MKLSLKLPLAFTVSLLLLFAAALFGISRLNQALDTYQTTVAQSFEHERMAAGMLNNFKVQVQEWKNVLLRGRTRPSSRATGPRLKSRNRPSRRRRKSS